MVHIYASHISMILLAYFGSGSLLDSHLLFTTMSTRPLDNVGFGLLVSQSFFASYPRRKGLELSTTGTIISPL